MTEEADPVRWLTQGDPAVAWQALRDLLGAPQDRWKAERERVAFSGWGAALLARRAPDGLWGGGVYTPKWTSTTYTLLLLRRLGLPPGHPSALESTEILVERARSPDGGVNFWKPRSRISETCVTGMVLSIVTWFGLRTDYTESIIDYLLQEQMDDGGWNCRRFRGATHGSFHTTINVLEGLRGYVEADGSRAGEVTAAEARAQEFFLCHRLYRSHRTGRVSKPEFTRFSFPPRWRHDVLRTLDYFQSAEAPLDSRLEDPVELLRGKRDTDGRWPLQNRHPGRTFFEMEGVGEPSRWNTLRAMRVLKWWGEGPGGYRQLPRP